MQYSLVLNRNNMKWRSYLSSVPSEQACTKSTDMIPHQNVWNGSMLSQDVPAGPWLGIPRTVSSIEMAATTDRAAGAHQSAQTPMLVLLEVLPGVIVHVLPLERPRLVVQLLRPGTNPAAAAIARPAANHALGAAGLLKQQS